MGETTKRMSGNMPEGPLFFFDSSAAIKYYQAESGSALIEDIVDNHPVQCYISALSSAEVTKGIRKHKYRLMDSYGKERHEEILRGYKDTIQEWRADLNDELWLLVFGDVRTVAYASDLLYKYDRTDDWNFKDASDAWILATALALRDETSRAVIFVSADEKTGLNKAAQLEGLEVINPDLYPYTTYQSADQISAEGS